MDKFKALLVDPEIPPKQRELVRELYLGYCKLVDEKSWRNPYSEAISLLTTAARAHEGGYG